MSLLEVGHCPEESSTSTIISATDSVDNQCTELVAIGRPVGNTANGFNPVELSRMSELLVAYDSQPMLVSDIKSVVTSLSEVLRISCLVWDYEIRKTVKSSNQLVAFKSLCEDDKVTLLKHAIGEIVLLKSVYVYEKYDEYWYCDVVISILNISIA